MIDQGSLDYEIFIGVVRTFRYQKDGTSIILMTNWLYLSDRMSYLTLVFKSVETDDHRKWDGGNKE